MAQVVLHGMARAGTLLVVAALLVASGGLIGIAPVRAAGTPPVADDQAASTPQSTALDLTLAAHDPEGGGSLSFDAEAPGHGVVAPTSGSMTCVDSTGVSDCTASVAYTPTTGYHGADSFTFTATDPEAETSSPATVSIEVNSPPIAFDDPGVPCGGPPGFGGAFPIPEDWSEPFGFFFGCGLLANDTDADGDPLTARIVTQPSHGTLIQLPDPGSFAYQPDPNYSTIAGDQPGGDWISDSFRYVANDGVADSAPATMRFWIAPINDPPTFTPGPSTVQVAENSGPHTGAWATAVLPGPSNESAQHVHFDVTNVDTHGTPGLFAVAPAVGPDGTLTFTPGGGQVGLASVTVEAVDDGGLDDYGMSWPQMPVPDDTSDPVTFTIEVSPDAAPVAIGDTAETLEDVPIAVIDVLANDTDPDGDTLTVSDFDAVSAQGGSVSDNGDGTLAYSPPPNFDGADTFDYTVSDGTDSDSATVTITVDPVNDPPAGTSAAVATREDVGYVFDVDDFGFSDPNDSPPNGLAAVRISTLPAAGSLTDDGVTVSAGSEVSATDITAGKLVFSPAADANGAGYASFTFQVRDDGGTANGGVALDPNPRTMTVNVTAVNDPPSFTPGADPTVAEDSGPYSSGWATAISPGPDESGQAVSFVVTADDNTALFASQPVIASDGNLTFTPAAQRHGAAHLTLHAVDDGGTANGGDATSGNVALTITVTSVNDPPNAANDTTFVVGENAGATALDVLANDSYLPDDPEVLTIVGVTQGAHGSVAIAGGGSTLTYRPASMYVGSDTFTYTIQDPGGLTDSATVVVTVARDTAPPTTSVPIQHIRTGVTMASTTMLAAISWSGSDAGVGIASYQLQRSVNGGSWAVTLASATSTSVSVSLTFGSTYRFRVRAVDRNGNTGAWVNGVIFTVGRSQESSGYVHYSGTWARVHDTSDSDGYARETAVAGRSVSYTRKVRDVAFVAPTSSARGSVQVYVDGVYQATISLKTSTTMHRRVLWAWHTSSIGTHTFTFVVVGTGRVDVDCFVVLN